MKGDGTVSLREVEKTIEELLALTDKEINAAARSDLDAQPTDYEFWENAEVVTPEMRALKQLTIRIDWEVYEWLKTQGRDYQTLINNVLKSYVEAQKHPSENGGGTDSQN